MSIIAFVSYTSHNKDLTLLKVTEVDSARISYSAIVGGAFASFHRRMIIRRKNRIETLK
ncbi:hypothetical protein MNBD_IGNAVI01-583 [hydrothermal vent metagenome]|uniref:Uncharacterized protein n=1 Tax=hydrothermal vent metagenome TaxID=652676 RepID=A0A3B1C2D4_9ZZZZ